MTRHGAEERYKFFGASYLLLRKDNEILLQRRFNTGYADGLYTLPSGHIEENESFIDAAKREAFEESGVIVNKNDIKLFTVMQRKTEIGTYIDFFCVTDKWEKDPYVAEKDKCDEIIWCDINNLPSNTISYVKTAIYNYINNINYNILNEIKL